jgi:aromatic ring-opening dioxygenase catalytic subunit (LigB family)
MLLINPKADIPIIQLSVLSSESPSQHYAMGRALATLRDSNVAIIGSGFASFHNLGLMFSGRANDSSFKKRNMEWSRAVTDAALSKQSEERLVKFENWRNFPNSYEMHPRGGAEHFLPLIVCAGAGEDEKAGSYTDKFMNLDMYSYYWN